MSLFDNSGSHPYTYYFSSELRQSGTNGSFTSHPLDLGINNYDSVCVQSAQIPRTFYNVPTGKNTFTVIQNGVSTVCTLSIGSYNKYNLRTQLQTKLQAISDGRIYTVTYPSSSEPDTFKYTFNFTGGVGNVNFLFSNNRLIKQLGFDNGTYAFSTGSLMSVNCINLSFINKCFIKSNIIDENDSLAEIINYGSTPMLSLCFYQQTVSDLNTRIFSQSNKNSWLFTLEDSFGEIIDLNGIPWSFVLIWYKRNDVHQFHKNELQMVNEERLQRILDEQNKLKNKLLSDSEKEKDSTTENKNTSMGINIENNDNNEKKNDNKPIYPVFAFGSSSFVKTIL